MSQLGEVDAVAKLGQDHFMIRRQSTKVFVKYVKHWQLSLFNSIYLFFLTHSSYVSVFLETVKLSINFPAHIYRHFLVNGWIVFFGNTALCA